MDAFEMNLKLLTDILEKKKDCLFQILCITQNQETLLKGMESIDQTDTIRSFDQMFDEMNEEKQKLIDDVLNCDSVFQKFFAEINDQLEGRAEIYKEHILTLQTLIKDITDYDIKIRVQEQRNKDQVLKNHRSTKIKIPKVSKEYLLKQYNKNAHPKGKHD